jgi:hypothetical protein
MDASPVVALFCPLWSNGDRSLQRGGRVGFPAAKLVCSVSLLRNYQPLCLRLSGGPPERPMPTEKRTVALEHASACFLWVTMQSIKHNAPSNVHYRLGCVKAQTFGTRVSGMRTSAKGVKKTELLILDSKKLRQAGIRRLLDIWAEAMGLTVKAVVPDAPLDTCCTPDNCEMTIISLGGASIEDAPNTLGDHFRPGRSKGDMRCF